MALTSRINHVHIENFKSLANVDVDLTDLNVLVGVNGSGKSNFIDALRFVRDALVRDSLNDGLMRAADSRGGTDVLRHQSVDNENFEIVIKLDFTIEEQSGEYKVALGIGNSVPEEFCKFGSYQFGFRYGQLVDNSFPDPENEQLFKMSWERNNLSSPNALFLPSMAGLFFPQLKPLVNFLSRMRFYSIFPEILRRPQPQDSSHNLDEDGKNLSQILRDMLQSKDNTWRIQTVIDALSTIAPNISSEDSIKIDQTGSFLLGFLKHKNEKWFDLSQESDGTLRVLSILTALYHDLSLPLLTFEEPEMMVHPHAIAVLNDVFRAASRRTQIIITTHSPDLISNVDVDSLRAVELEDGKTKIGKIREGQRQTVIDKLFNAGDLLRIQGLHVESK